MFGYVTPCKMEMKIKDYEKFKAYYCGLCNSIKKTYGNLPRAVLNYDMAFLAVLLDSLTDVKCTFKIKRCFVHPIKKRIVIVDNKALQYAAVCNITLAYYKLLDNVEDDNSIPSRIGSLFLNNLIKNNSSVDFKKHSAYIKNSLEKLQQLEKKDKFSLDEISDIFADLTGYLISSYINTDAELTDTCQETLYWLGYNLGKWIYIIDAWDDLEKDMNRKKFNILNSIYNKSDLDCEEFKKQLEEKIDFQLVTCASNCLEQLEKLPLRKNESILYNILQYGLMEKMDIVFKRSDDKNGKSL